MARPMAGRAFLRLNLVFEPPELLSLEQRAQGFSHVALALSSRDFAVTSGAASPLSLADVTVNHLATLILNRFQLHDTCFCGVAIQLGAFTLPPWQSLCALDDGDTVSVRRVQPELPLLPPDKPSLASIGSLSSMGWKQQSLGGTIKAAHMPPQEKVPLLLEGSMHENIQVERGNRETVRRGRVSKRSGKLGKMRRKAGSGGGRGMVRLLSRLGQRGLDSGARGAAVGLTRRALNGALGTRRAAKKGTAEASELDERKALVRKEKSNDVLEEGEEEEEEGEEEKEGGKDDTEEEEGEEEEEEKEKEEEDESSEELEQGRGAARKGAEEKESEEDDSSEEEDDTDEEQEEKVEQKESKEEEKQSEEEQEGKHGDHGKTSIPAAQHKRGNGAGLKAVPASHASPAKRPREGPSRSTRRKKIKRQREAARIKEEKERVYQELMKQPRGAQANSGAVSRQEHSEKVVVVRSGHWRMGGAGEEAVPMIAADAVEGTLDEASVEEGAVAAEVDKGPVGGAVMSVPQARNKRQGQQWGQERSKGGLMSSGFWNAPVGAGADNAWQSDRGGDRGMQGGVQWGKAVSVGGKDVATEPAVVQPEVMLQDFSTYPLLEGTPRVGDNLAYKTVVLSPLTFTPEISDYRDGIVSEFNEETNTVTLTRTQSTVNDETQGVQCSEGAYETEMEEGESAWMSLPPYEPDGTLRINLAELLEVRVVSRAKESGELPNLREVASLHQSKGAIGREETSGMGLVLGEAVPSGTEQGDGRMLTQAPSEPQDRSEAGGMNGSRGATHGVETAEMGVLLSDPVLSAREQGDGKEYGALLTQPQLPETQPNDTAVTQGTWCGVSDMEQSAMKAHVELGVQQDGEGQQDQQGLQEGQGQKEQSGGVHQGDPFKGRARSAEALPASGGRSAQNRTQRLPPAWQQWAQTSEALKQQRAALQQAGSSTGDTAQTNGTELPNGSIPGLKQVKDVPMAALQHDAAVANGAVTSGLADEGGSQPMMDGAVGNAGHEETESAIQDASVSVQGSERHTPITEGSLQQGPANGQRSETRSNGHTHPLVNPGPVNAGASLKPKQRKSQFRGRKAAGLGAVLALLRSEPKDCE